MARPPYLRWATVVALIATAFAWELRPPDTVSYPFATTAIEAGAEISSATVEYRTVPADLLPDAIDLDGVVARHRIGMEEPIMPADVIVAPPIPPGMWVVGVPTPSGASVGDAVLLVWSGRQLEPTSATGLVLRGGSEGLVAVFEDVAAPIAAAARSNGVTVLVRPSG